MLAMTTEGDRRNPALVLLHGFLGCGADWQATVSQLNKQFYCICLDLPGHGATSQLDSDHCAGLDDCCAQIDATLNAIGVTKSWLVGYSLGGRIAMHYVSQYLPECYPSGKNKGFGLVVCGLILESANPGLVSDCQREMRWQNDHRWAVRFRRESLSTVLNDWYQQPVFASLSLQERQAMIMRRLTNDGLSLAAMLEATSLSRQTYLGDVLCRQDIPMLYLCGAEDDVFHRIGQQLSECQNMTLVVQAQAGHNVHVACPASYADTILSFYASHGKTTEFDDE